MANAKNYKYLKLTTGHGVVEDPPGTFTPATVAFQLRHADGSLETTVGLTVISTPSPKSLVVDLDTSPTDLVPCCANFISGPSAAACPELAAPANDCTPPAGEPDLVDPVTV